MLAATTSFIETSQAHQKLSNPIVYTPAPHHRDTPYQHHEIGFTKSTQPRANCLQQQRQHRSHSPAMNPLHTSTNYTPSPQQTTFRARPALVHYPIFAHTLSNLESAQHVQAQHNTIHTRNPPQQPTRFQPPSHPPSANLRYPPASTAVASASRQKSFDKSCPAFAVSGRPRDAYKPTLSIFSTRRRHPRPYPRPLSSTIVRTRHKSSPQTAPSASHGQPGSIWALF